MKKTLVIISLFLVSLGINCPSFAQNATPNQDNVSTLEKVSETQPKKIEVNNSGKKNEEPKDIQSLVLEDTYDLNNLITKALKGLFLAVGGFLALVAFLLLRNKSKNKAASPISSQQYVEQETTQYDEGSLDSEPINIKSETNPDELKAAVYNFFNLNK